MCNPNTLIGGREAGSFGPVTASLQAAYWKLHEDARYVEPVRYQASTSAR
ncbi:MAG: hypothetical protein KJZ83_08720 [Burkholderiaceae bacterium]|nr:hypothetical protein [Burkholderiaceae bacterium]